MPNGTVIIIDFMALAHQAKHSMGGLRTPEDTPSGVTFGVLSRVLALGHLFQTNQFAFCFDSPVQDSLRRREFPGYKLKRELTKSVLPEEEQQLEKLFRIECATMRKRTLPLIGFKNLFYADGYESDDFIARVIRDNCADARFIMVTSDEDMFQCLKKGLVKMYHLHTSELLSEDDFCRDHAPLIPKQWALYKSIAGCTSDEVPGIKGIGPESTMKWFRGELKGKKLDLITSCPASYKELMLKLVTLPFPGCPGAVLQSDKFSRSGFLSICETYALNSFLGEHLEAWKQFFKGDFPEKEQTHKRPAHGAVRRRK